MKNSTLKPHKVFLSDQEYQAICKQAGNAGLPFSAYARETLMNRKTSSEAPLRQALASKLPEFENIIKTIPNNIEAKDDLTMWGNETWQLLW